jgi:hypothetical protein
MNELMLNLQQIKVTKGSVEFPDYETIKQQAIKLADFIKTVEVNEDNLKESKKMLAAVNKRKKELEDERIRIKKMMLEPYQEFESQVKNIVAIVDDANEVVRQQVKQLEEFERQVKQDVLQDLFEKRKKMYTLSHLLQFEHFFQPKYLNKTISIEAVENEMIAFLEGTEKDMKVMQNLQDTISYIHAYLKSFDLATAISQVDEEKQRKEQIQALQGKPKAAALRKFTFTVFNEKDKMLLEMFMQQNKIQFEMKG